MNQDHDHAAMLASSTPSAQHDHPAGTNTVGSGHGLNMMMMAVSINFNIKSHREIFEYILQNKKRLFNR
jgi:hypothetical protein